jgi:calmodulin-regulated spectrin-associated protein
MSWKSSSPSQQQKPQDSFVLHHQNGRDSHLEAQRLFPVVHANLKAEPSNPNMSSDDMMAPQSISFIGDDEDEADNFQYKNSERSYRQDYNNHKLDDLEVSLGKLNITSGSRTYRIPSPTTRNHPGIAGNSFQSMESQNENDGENEKGFYISFDNATAPKRPKPPLRKNRLSKKPGDDLNNSKPEIQEVVSKKAFEVQESYKPAQSETLSSDFERPRYSNGAKKTQAQALIITNNESSSDPVSIKFLL